MTLDKQVGSLLGGDVITISGISASENDNIICTFGNKEVEGLYIDENQILCITPPAEESVVDFTISIVRKAYNITGGARYQYGNIGHVYRYCVIYYF